MSRLLITGGSGFIGRNLVDHWGKRHEVFAPSRSELNLLDACAVRNYVEAHRFDVVVHSATERSNRRVGSAQELLENNCRMFFNLERNWQAFGRMLFLSSGAVYDRAHWRSRMSEDYFDTHVPGDDYGFSKYICAKAVDGAERIYELRLFGVFGPYEDWQVRFLSNACCRAIWDLPVLIRRNVLFDYLDVEDLSRILERFFAGDLRQRHYNICSGRSFDLKTLAAKVVAASGQNLEILTIDDNPGIEYGGDNRAMLEELPGFCLRDMDDSIGSLYRWYEERKTTIDPALLRFDDKK